MNKTKGYNYILILVMALIVMTAMLCTNVVPIYNNVDDNLTVHREGMAISMVSGDFKGATIGDIDNSRKTLNKVGLRIGITNLDKSLKFSRALNSVGGQALRYQQVYKGIEVYGREMVVNVDNDGNILYISGNYLGNIQPTNSQKLSQDDIKLLAKDNTIVDIMPAIYTLQGNGAKYAFVADCTDKTIIYDQSSGRVIDSIHKEQRVVTTQTNALGEQVKIDVAQSYGKNYLQDNTRNIMVYDYSKRSGDLAPLYNWSGQLEDRIAVSVYDYLVRSYDFYADANNVGVARNGIADDHDDIASNYEDEYILQVYVHYEEKPGVPYVNAAYSDDKTNGLMVIGDGERGKYNDFGKAFDVIAHEYQHGVTSHTANLIYRNQSGAINEAMSDIFAVCIGDDSLDDPNAWLIGEQIVDNGKKAMRDMANPMSLGYPYQVGGDNYHEECNSLHNHSTSNCDAGGVHVNSSIINNVAYNIYNADRAFFTKQRIATLWYNTLLSLPRDCNYKVLKEIMLQTAVERLGYSQTHLEQISKAFATANITTKTTIFFQNNDSEIKGELPEAITINDGESITLPNANLTKEGHILVGWKEVDYNGNTTKRYYLDAQDSLFYADKTSIVLYPLMALQPMNTAVGVVELEGGGTFNDPYLVNNEQDFMSMAYYINNADVYDNSKTSIVGETVYSASYYLLTADIDMSKITRHFTPINIKNLAKTVYLDGNGHHIKGINIDINQLHTPTSVGLFSTLYGEVSRLSMDMIITGDKVVTEYVGAVAGVLHGVINSVAVSADINITNAIASKIRIGGIAGYSAKGIADVSFEGSIQSNTRNTVAGGIIGVANSDVSNQSVGIESDTIIIRHSTDTNQNYHSRSNSTVANNVINYGDITAHVSGGIIGEIYHGKVVNTLNFGKISANSMGGGIVGRVADWGGYDGGVWVSDNKKMRIGNAEVYLAGCHNIGEVVASSAGAMLGNYAKQGYKLILEKCFGTQNVSIVGAYERFAGQDVVRGDVEDNSQVAYSDSTVYVNNNYFATMGGGTPFAIDTLWRAERGRLVANSGVKSWIELADTEYGGGKGTKAQPYIISTAAQLGKVAQDSLLQKTASEVFYKQTANIDLNGGIWHSIGAKAEKEYLESKQKLHYFAQGFAITNMIARQQKLTIDSGKSNEYSLELQSSFMYGKNYNVNGLNVADCNMSGDKAAGIAVLGDSIRYCNVYGYISATSDVGGIAVSATSIEYCVSTATLGGTRIGGVAVASMGNISGNYVAVVATLAGGEELASPVLGGIVAITTAVPSNLTILNNNTVNVSAVILSDFADVGGVIGRITDTDSASVSLLNNKAELHTDAVDGGDVSIGGLIGNGDIFTKVKGGMLKVKAEGNGYSPMYNECGHNWDASIDIANYYSKKNQVISDAVAQDYVQDSVATIIMKSIENNEHIAYLMKNGEVMNVVPLVDGKFVCDGTKMVGAQEKFEGWVHADNTIVQDEQYEKNIYVYAKSSAIEDEEKGTGFADGDNSLSWVWLVVITVGTVFAVGALVMVMVMLVRRNKRI